MALHQFRSPGSEPSEEVPSSSRRGTEMRVLRAAGDGKRCRAMAGLASEDFNTSGSEDLQVAKPATISTHGIQFFSSHGGSLLHDCLKCSARTCRRTSKTGSTSSGPSFRVKLCQEQPQSSRLISGEKDGECE